MAVGSRARRRANARIMHLLSRICTRPASRSRRSGLSDRDGRSIRAGRPRAVWDRHTASRPRLEPKPGRVGAGFLRHVASPRTDDPGRRGRRHPPGHNAAPSKSPDHPVTAAPVILFVGTAARLSGALALGKLDVPTGQHRAQVPRWACPGGRGPVGVARWDRQRPSAPRPALRPSGDRGSRVPGHRRDGGIAASLLPDKDGWVGFAVHPASPGRILGAVPMVAGVAPVAPPERPGAASAAASREGEAAPAGDHTGAAKIKDVL